MRPRQLLSALVLSLLCLAAPLSATWSILLIDTRTGEVAIGSATCVIGINLRRVTAVVRVGRGAAAAQAQVNQNSITNRALIWTLLGQQVSPAQILAALEAQDPIHQRRQYGIIDVSGSKVTFSGTENAAWAGGVTGSVGTIHYAIQGNILTGAAVVTAAEQALRNTNGDLAERLMASMEAARLFGGDGRCSCNGTLPESCGSPPASFTKSAHVGFMVVARQGDVEGDCVDARLGCATGSYFMNLNVPSAAVGPIDPVIQLRTQFDAWRSALIGRPDHHLSTVSLDPPSLVPDGVSTTRITVRLRDWQGTALSGGGATLGVSEDPTSTASVTIGAVVDNGDGSYTFPVTAGLGIGTSRLSISVDDGQGPVLLSPRTPIEVRDDALWADTAMLSAASGGTVNLQLDAGASGALRSYVVAASGSGTSPGIPFPPSTLIPLNFDPWFDISIQLANSQFFGNTLAVLDLGGRAAARFAMPGSNFLAPAIGLDLDFAYFTLGPIDFASNPVRVTIVP